MLINKVSVAVLTDWLVAQPLAREAWVQIPSSEFSILSFVIDRFCLAGRKSGRRYKVSVWFQKPLSADSHMYAVLRPVIQLMPSAALPFKRTPLSPWSL